MKPIIIGATLLGMITGTFVTLMFCLIVKPFDNISPFTPKKSVRSISELPISLGNFEPEEEPKPYILKEGDAIDIFVSKDTVKPLLSILSKDLNVDGSISTHFYHEDKTILVIKGWGGLVYIPKSSLLFYYK